MLIEALIEAIGSAEPHRRKIEDQVGLTIGGENEPRKHCRSNDGDRVPRHASAIAELGKIE